MIQPHPAIHTFDDAPADPPPLGELIRLQRCALARSLHQVARAAGCSRSYLSQIENSRVPPPGEALLARLELALHLSPGQLAQPARAQRRAGRRDRAAAGGAQLRRDLARIETALARLTGWLTETKEENEAPMIPVIPVITEIPPGAPGNIDPHGDDELAPLGSIRVPGVRDPAAFAVRLVGDAMAPQYRAGDLVIFSPAKRAASGADCFVRFAASSSRAVDGASGVFGRVSFTETGPVRIQPLNSAHPARLIPRGEIAGVHPAVTVIRSIL